MNEERTSPPSPFETLVDQESTTPSAGFLLVEFEGAGFREVAKTPDDLARESAAAVAKAMDTIREMGERVRATVDSMSLRPTKVEVTFGVKLDAEVGAIIAKASGGASIEVKLAWEHPSVDEHGGSG